MERRRSLCPIATTLDVLGDRWSLVVARDLLNGKRTFSDFLGSPEGISTNILADRLKRLEAAGLVIRTPYHERPQRYAYRLTDDGEALLPVLQEICRWANKVWPETWIAPKEFMTREPERPSPSRVSTPQC